MYEIASPYFLSATSSAIVIHDKPLTKKAIKQKLVQQFDDLYHLFLVKVAEMPQQKAVTYEEEKRLSALFSELHELKRELER